MRKIQRCNCYCSISSCTSKISEQSFKTFLSEGTTEANMINAREDFLNHEYYYF